VEGGSANDYDYCSGDPVNCLDLDGLKRRPLTPAEARQVDKIAGECRSGDRYMSPSAFCKGFLKGLAKGDLTDYGFGFVPDTRKRYVHCPAWLKRGASTLGVGGYARAYNQLGNNPRDAAITAGKTTGIYALEEGGLRVAGHKRLSPYATGGATAVDAVCTNL
jgi:hypothetical protein